MALFFQILNHHFSDQVIWPARKLIGLYARRGRRASALKIYRELQKALQTELDTKPDPATTAIYREILDA